MKNLIYDKESISHFSGGYILVDNTALIESSREHNNPMLQFLDILSNLNCDLITTPSVHHEFIRGAKNLVQNNDFIKMFDELGIEVLKNTEVLFTSKENALFRIAYCQEAKRASFTDTELAVTAYQYRNNNVGILTENYRDFPSSLFKRTSYIAFSHQDSIRTHAIFTVQLEQILKRTFSKYIN